MTVLVSWLALFALLYQVYLQRVHNEKSLKPLGQIDLEDRQGHIYVRVTNNGLGPMIVDRLIFQKDGKSYTAIEGCLELDSRSYTRISVNESVRKVILPNGHLVIFDTRLEASEGDAQRVRQQLSLITLKVEFHDIYDNKMTIERNFQWFARHMSERNQTSL
ncbi:hypothetical protein GO755_20560 [Spirosoma sp. HMF4905]|uniref:Uncharacterized protein n=1 Tax=Spirosoma arboris TaxID=2682092 RepID=A0A7K1SF57_9BACT|nr:hypothetical protein [Spirosoma arboris]MVM32449.1 hypothetical protein [Spirosoma arboris]